MLMLFIEISIIVFIIALIYFILYSRIKVKIWKPWSRLSDIDDQLSYWSDELVKCFEHLEKIKTVNTDLFSLITGLQISNNISNSISDIKEDYATKGGNSQYIMNKLQTIHTTNSSNHIERLLLKYELIKVSKTDDLEVLIKEMFYHRAVEKDEEDDLSTRFLLFDFMIDYTKTFCKYKHHEFYNLYHKENMNFYTQQSMRDSQKNKKTTISSSDASLELLKSLQSAIPFMPEPQLDVENMKINELNPYDNPSLKMATQNLDYLNISYSLLINEYILSPTRSGLVKSTRNEMWTVILDRVAQVDIHHNYQLLTDYLKFPKGKVENDLKALVDLYKLGENKTKSYYNQKCLDINKNLKKEEQAIINLPIHEYVQQSSYKENLYSFEELINKLESKYGPGLLTIDHTKLMKNYHTLILYEDYEQHSSTIDTISNLPEDTKKTFSEIILSLQKMDILVSNDLPTLLYYDMMRSTNMERTLLYYIRILRRTGNQIEILLNVLLDVANVFSNSQLRKYKSLDINILNIGMTYFYKMRNYYHTIANDIPGFIIDNFNWVDEGFREKYEEMEERSNGPVTEHFGGLNDIKKFFRGIMSFVKALIAIIKILTSPVKMIKLALMCIYSIYTLVMAMVERYTNIFSSLLIIVYTFIVIVVYTITYVIYVLIMYVIGLIDLSLLKGLFSKFVYQNLTGIENDIRSWFKVPSFEQGNKVISTIIGNCGTCPPRYDSYILYCKRKQDYIPSFSNHSSIYKLYNNESLSSNPLFIGDFKPTIEFNKQSKSGKDSMIRKANLTKKMYTNKIDAFFKKNANIHNVNKTVCANVDNLDISDKESLHLHCRELFCKNGEYMSSCLQFEPNDSDISSFINDTDGKFTNMFLNSLGYIVLLFIILSLYSYPFMKVDGIELLKDKIENLFEMIPSSLKQHIINVIPSSLKQYIPK